MANVNAFDSDLFTAVELTSEVNQAPAGTVVDNSVMGLFEEDFVTTPNIYIQKEDQGLTLVPFSEPGGAGSIAAQADKREAIPLKILHNEVRATVTVAEIRGVTAGGGQTEIESLQNYVTKRLLKMRRSLDATTLLHSVSALQGNLKDADGTVKLDMFNLMGVTQQTQALGLVGTGVRGKILTAIEKAEDVVGDAGMIIGWTGLLGRTLFKQFIDSDDVAKSYLNWQAAEALRVDNRKGFMFSGVEWRSYYSHVGSTTFLAPTEGYLIPVIAGNAMRVFGPGDTDSTYDVAAPYIASIERLPHGKGVELLLQRNAVHYLARPDAVIKLIA